MLRSLYWPFLMPARLWGWYLDCSCEIFSNEAIRNISSNQWFQLTILPIYRIIKPGTIRGVFEMTDPVFEGGKKLRETIFWQLMGIND